MKSNLISKSETTALLKTVSERWGIEFPKIKNVKVHQILDESFEDTRGIEQTMPRSQEIVKKVSYDNGKTGIEIPEVRNIRIVD